jgi:hypothetical protein
VPDGIPVYVGSYGPSGDVAHQAAEFPNGRYAPMFALQEPHYREERRVPPEQAGELDPRFAGAAVGYVGEEYPRFEGNPRPLRLRRPRASVRSPRAGPCETPSPASTSPG